MFIQDLVKKAIDNDAVKDILIGIPPFEYNTKYSCSPTGHDITSVLEEINKTKDKHVINKLSLVLIELSQTYEGVIPCLSVLLFIELKKKNEQNNIVIDNKCLINNVLKTIDKYKYDYICDNTGDGFGFKDGKYGEIKRLINILNSDFESGINFQ